MDAKTPQNTSTHSSVPPSPQTSYPGRLSSFPSIAVENWPIKILEDAHLACSPLHLIAGICRETDTELSCLSIAKAVPEKCNLL